MTEAQGYAEEIRRQLYWAKENGFPIAWSWGMNKFVCSGDPLLLDMENGSIFEREARAWLGFNVSGRIHKGLVYVILTGSDDYTILLVVKRRKKMPNMNCVQFRSYYEVVSETEGIYCDELARTVDRLVETPEKVLQQNG